MTITFVFSKKYCEPDFVFKSLQSIPRDFSTSEEIVFKCSEPVFDIWDVSLRCFQIHVDRYCVIYLFEIVSRRFLKLNSHWSIASQINNDWISRLNLTGPPGYKKLLWFYVQLGLFYSLVAKHLPAKSSSLKRIVWGVCAVHFMAYGRVRL